MVMVMNHVKVHAASVDTGLTQWTRQLRAANAKHVLAKQCHPYTQHPVQP